MCLGSIGPAPSKSAMVRATFNIRSCARAVRPCWVMARSKSRSQSEESSQKERICRGAIWALQYSLVRVAGRKSAQLNLARGHDSCANRAWIPRLRSGAHFFVVHRGDINMNIDPVQQRSGNFCHVALNHGLSAMALGRAVVEVSAWLRVLTLLNGL